MATLWPGGARGCICLTFDNLGEAAEIELGASTEADAGDHFTATEVVPELLDHLAEHKLPATFFVEGLNTRLYPDTLKSIDTAGHEIAYHAWRHEDWSSLSADEQTANLARGTAAFDELGIEIAGLRPPGGALGEGGQNVLREVGLRYCSPAGAGAGVDTAGGGAGGAAGVIALLPFQWRHVDASCLLPPLAPVREQMTGSPDPIDPAGFVDYLSSEIDRLRTDGGYLSIVLHLYLVHHWLGWENLAALLDRVAAARHEDPWVATCAEAASHVLAEPGAFSGATHLDAGGWT